MDPADSIPDDIDALRAELVAERVARREAETRAVGAEAMVAHLKFVIAKLEHHRYAPSSERGRKLLDQAELQLEESKADAAEKAVATEVDAARRAAWSGASRAASLCVALYRHICRASVLSSLVQPHAPAVAGHWPNWERPSPRAWRAFRGGGRSG
jgi:transposase